MASSEQSATRTEALLGNWAVPGPGKMTNRGYEISGRGFARDMRRKGVSEYLQRDATIEHYLQATEKIENLVNDVMLHEPICDKLRDMVERSPHHGRPHFRRIEKWEKWADKHDTAIRHSPVHLYFKVPEKLAKRGHDLVEVLTGKKEGHDAAGALFTFGYMMENVDTLVPIINEELGLTYPITLDDWTAWAWATAFICEHHSKPEKMSTIAHLVQQGVVDPAEFLRKTEDMAQKYGEESIYTLFPPFAIIRPFIERIRERKILPYRGFTQNELDALRTRGFRFSAADKLDGTFPADLAGARMILTRPDRAFYERMSKPGLTLLEELDARVQDGGAHESSCDLNRILFELTRTQALGEFPSHVRHAFRVGMQLRSSYYLRAIDALLHDDTVPFLESYESLERHEIVALLGKIGVQEIESKVVVQMSEEDDRHRSVRALLKKYGYDGAAFDDVLYKIHNEKAIVGQALLAKIQLLRERSVSSEEKAWIMQLLKRAVEVQKNHLPITQGPMKFDPPYDSYYPLDVEKWKLSS